MHLFCVAENVAKEMEERMEKEIPFNPDNKMDPSVPDNVGATKNRAPDNEGAIKIPAPNNDGEMKDPALGDEGAMTNPAQDIEGAIKATALDTKGLLADDDGAKETPLAVNEGSTKSSVHEERAKEMDKEDDAAVVASIKAEIYRQQMKYALLTSANEELKRNVSRIEHDIENVVNTSEFRQQTVELSMITFQDLNNELFHNNLWQIRESQIAKKKIKELEDLQAENAKKITELTEATTNLADANAKLLEAGLARQEEIEMLREQLKEATKKKPSRWQRFKARVRFFFV
ncbi:uncharacterized protein LOC116617745 isoform X3 [Nematostella vectensis]|uniref:uncharacterized protein LOC116617745 isoform X3 n=1 Tax=Nematostella vectensis TaxID=45351 RepID=UPI0020771767|nr:uncharacterized protein LOC116617745 isoform X3 [Nematostella vectensis]